MDDRPALWTTRLGTVPYDEATDLQNAVAEARREGALPDVLLLLEHPPVLTKGRRTDPRELGMGEDWYRMQGIEIAEADRGGRVTYHGPGQLVAYPIVDLTALGDGPSPDVHAYVRSLERVMIGALAAHAVPAQVFDGLTGVWTAGRPPVPIGAPGPEGTEVAARDADLAGRDQEARKIGSIGDPSQPRSLDARACRQRQQRPAALRVGRPLRHGIRADDVGRAGAGSGAGSGPIHGHDRERVRAGAGSGAGEGQPCAAAHANSSRPSSVAGSSP